MMKATILLLFFIKYCLADTPANCTYDDIQGTWIFSESERINDLTEECNGTQKAVRTLKIDLTFPNFATDEHGNTGHWTLIYNQGFEVTINYRKYFAFSLYKTEGNKVYSYCHKTLPGWSHDILEHNWACWTGVKDKQENIKINENHLVNTLGADQHSIYKQNNELIAMINRGKNLWKAKKYEMFENKTIDEIIKMNGGLKSRLPRYDI